MRDVNEPVRVAYAGALTQIPGLETSVFYQAMPNNLNLDNYLVFRSITNVDASTKSSADVNLSITVEIHTKNNVANPGLTADHIADQIFQMVYPDKQTNLTLSRGQILHTVLVSDRTLDYTLKGQFGYIDRFLTFRHWIFVDGTGNGGGMTASGQVFRLEYTGLGGEVGFTNSNLVNKRILDVSKDGISFSELLTTGTPVDKQVLYDEDSGAITFGMSIEPNEQVFVLYQLGDPFQVMRFEYTGVGGELFFTSTVLENKTVFGISRDGVMASQILSSGTPIGKEAKYEDSTGTITFGVELETNEKVIILYQLN
jgi:hypothetical protein